MQLRSTGFLLSLLGYLLILAGVFVFWLPIPLGLIMIGWGLYLLIRNSQAFKAFVRARREKHPRFNTWIIRVKPTLPAFIRETLDTTDPTD